MTGLKKGDQQGAGKGRFVLQRADGMEEAKGSTRCRQPHTHKHAPVTQALSHAWWPLCTHTTTPNYPFHPLTENEGISGDTLHQSTTRGSGHMAATIDRLSDGQCELAWFCHLTQRDWKRARLHLHITELHLIPAGIHGDRTHLVWCWV